ncbi:fibronectin type III domain-containing protein [Actinoplanes sp. TRM 88003]|uniref:Fibronectin type III domain-containing protein n=1 Tax=Paractinoplanes aksuensis TaxID=2939490 RepID=A0ABT1DT64_9ACTN|nr:fibronectin type III domain-containing protein [Actinoplanes aksuensis]MCO8274037.1 fibronectin type III domain-containing protein [Actinoplanes aksuensis]
MGAGQPVEMPGHLGGGAAGQRGRRLDVQVGPGRQADNRGCPPLTQPTTLTSSVSAAGDVNLSWSNYGRDMWYWVESRDVTAGTDWKRPELWQQDTSMTDIPVTDGDTQGHTFEWRVKPFANAGGGEVPASNVVRQTVTVQRPSQVTGVTATATGNGAIRVNWNATTHPSGRVYYFVDHWNITAGHTADQAVRSAPLEPGTTALSINFVPGTEMGFRVFARNIGGLSQASASVQAVA